MSPIIQGVVIGVVIALSIIGVGIKLNNVLISLKHNLDSISGSLETLEGSVMQVDFKEIEKTVERLEFHFEQSNKVTNSVEYQLSNSGIKVTISLLPESASEMKRAIVPKSDEELVESVVEEIEKVDEIEGIENVDEMDEVEHVDDFEDVEEVISDLSFGEDDLLRPRKSVELEKEERTNIMLEFEDRINSQSVIDTLSSDSELQDIELEMFGAEPMFDAKSPFEMEFVVPTEDYEEVAEWIPHALEKIDRYHMVHEEESEKFDSEIMKNLPESKLG